MARVPQQFAFPCIQEDWDDRSQAMASSRPVAANHSKHFEGAYLWLMGRKKRVYPPWFFWSQSGNALGTFGRVYIDPGVSACVAYFTMSLVANEYVIELDLEGAATTFSFPFVSSGSSAYATATGVIVPAGTGWRDLTATYVSGATQAKAHHLVLWAVEEETI